MLCVFRGALPAFFRSGNGILQSLRIPRARRFIAALTIVTRAALAPELGAVLRGLRRRLWAGRRPEQQTRAPNPTPHTDAAQPHALSVCLKHRAHKEPGGVLIRAADVPPQKVRSKANFPYPPPEAPPIFARCEAARRSNRNLARRGDLLVGVVSRHRRGPNHGGPRAGTFPVAALQCVA